MRNSIARIIHDAVSEREELMIEYMEPEYKLLAFSVRMIIKMFVMAMAQRI